MANDEAMVVVCCVNRSDLERQMKDFERNAQYVEAERARQQLEGLRKQ
jgi:hypothetical protein